MARGVGLDRRWQDVEFIHGAVVAVEIVLHPLHRLELLDPGFLGYLVLPLVGVVLQMAHVGDVAHIAHLVAQVAEVAEQDVERDGRTGVTQMAVAVDRGAADVHPDAILMDRTEKLLISRQGVVDGKLVRFHRKMALEGFKMRFSGISAFGFSLWLVQFASVHERIGCLAGVLTLVLGGDAADLAEGGFIALHVLAEGIEQVLDILGGHDDAALHLGLRHVGSHGDEIEVEFVAAVGYYGEVAVVSCCHFRGQLYFHFRFFLFHILFGFYCYFRKLYTCCVLPVLLMWILIPLMAGLRHTVVMSNEAISLVVVPCGYPFAVVVT